METKKFLETLFTPALEQSCGNIEIRAINNGRPQVSMHGTIDETLAKINQLKTAQTDVYIGVNTRVGNQGKKHNVFSVSAFHVDLDYGITGHKIKTEYASYEKAMSAIHACELQPTMTVHSGGGFHCYWVLRDPLIVSEYGIDTLEAINKALTDELHGDPGTHDISRILRIPGTMNYKIPDNPREVTIIECDGKYYSWEDFAAYHPHTAPEGPITSQPTPVATINLDTIPIDINCKNLIQHGNDGTFPSRSEVDIFVITKLMQAGVTDREITDIFRVHKVGEKYREHNAPDSYLSCTMEKARNYVSLNDNELKNPIFTSGSICRVRNNKPQLDIVRFQEYIANELHGVFNLEDNRIYKYNDKYYEACDQAMLNSLCQNELGEYRSFFTKAALRDFEHYFTGYNPVPKMHTDYIVLQNGAYNIDRDQLLPHSPEIHATSILSFHYDATASCDRFEQFLDEIFEGDTDKIMLIQEGIGYCFHQTMPTASMFFLIGNGANGKSVLLDIIESLFGEDNTSHVGMNYLGKEQYLSILANKMVNISSETINKRSIESDILKQVTAGDRVLAKDVYERPYHFKPYAKHFFAMNEYPLIEDFSHGMQRRIYPIEFNRRFNSNQADVYLFKKMKRELPGIFNWALEGYRRLKSRDYRFSWNAKMEKNKQQIILESNPIYEYAERHLQNAPGESVPFSDFYSRYMAYCQQHNHVPETKKKFGKMLRDIGYELGKSTQHKNQLHIMDQSVMEHVDIY